MGWLATFEVNRHHRSLWAVGDRETRKMTEVVHGFSVRSTLDILDVAIRKNAGFGANEPVGAAYAIFDSGTGPGQVPGLRSTVIIPRGHLRDDASVMTFPPMLMRLAGPRLDMAYKSEFLPRAYHVFGRIGFGEADVPRGLFKPLADDQEVTAAGSGKGTLVFKGQDLFTQWQRQAQSRGFGPEQVAEVLRSARAEAWKIGKPEDFNEPMIKSAIRSMSKTLLNWCLGEHQPGHSRQPDRQERRESQSQSISI